MIRSAHRRYAPCPKKTLQSFFSPIIRSTRTVLAIYKEIHMNWRSVCFILLIAAFAVGFIWADEGSNAFGTGFANALQRQLEIKQQSQSGQTPSYSPQQLEQPAPGLKGYVWRAYNNYGTISRADFMTENQCFSWVKTSGGYWRGCQLMERQQ